MGKATLTQLQESRGQVPFDQGLYHNQHYEKFMKELNELRGRFGWAYQRASGD